MTGTAPTAAAVRRSSRAPVLVGAAVLLAAVVTAMLTARPDSTRLDPRSAAASGSRAVAQVLGDLGVDVRLETTTAGVVAAAGPGSTLLVADPDLLVPSQVRSVRDTGADLVVVGPREVGSFAGSLTAAAESRPEVRAASCALPAARRAGRADAGGLGFALRQGTDGVGCFAVDGVPSLVQVREGTRTVTVLGGPAALTNSRFDEEGNAALVLGLLGGHDRLVWYLPSLSDVPPSAQQTSFYSLVPDGVWWGLGQLGVAVVVLMLWRARRLGPVVAEPLPVVVHAAETTEGQARLYRRAGARDTAAETLRDATRHRLAVMLGLPSPPRPAALVATVAAHCARSSAEVGALLYGAAPADDSSLVRLADELDSLDREVRRP